MAGCLTGYCWYLVQTLLPRSLFLTYTGISHRCRKYNPSLPSYQEHPPSLCKVGPRYHNPRIKDLWYIYIRFSCRPLLRRLQYLQSSDVPARHVDISHSMVPFLQ